MTLRERPLLVLCAIAVLSVLLAGSVAAAVPLFARVDGPAAVAPGQKALYNVTITGGPTANVSYSVIYYITGTNTSGGTPVASAPGRVSGNGTAYQINITAPQAEQSLTLVVTVDATPKGKPPENFTVNTPITVVRPIILSATFHNGAPTAAVNVTVRWYVDNGLVGTSEIKRIPADGDATASFNYLPLNLQPGQHVVRVEADLDHDGVVNPARGEVVTSTIFYKQAQPLSTGWTVLAGIGVFFAVFLAVVAVRRRGGR